VGLFLANPYCAFSRSAYSISIQKHPKKIRLVAQCYLLFKIKNLLHVHHFFDQSGLIRGNGSLYHMRGVLFMCIISQLTPRSPRNIAYLFITIQQLIEICETTPFRHQSSTMAELLVHQSHIQSSSMCINLSV